MRYLAPAMLAALAAPARAQIVDASTPTPVAQVAVSTPAAPAAVSTPEAPAAVAVSTREAPAPVAVSTPETAAVPPAPPAPVASTPTAEDLTPLVELPPMSRAFNSTNKLQLSGHASAYLGQFLFQGQSGSINGYGDAYVSASESLSARQGFLVDASAVYTGFKQVNELVGGGTLFQQSLDLQTSAKWISRVSGDESFKPRLGFKYEFFRQTNDETFGTGLYNYWRAEAGLGWEKKVHLGPAVSLTNNVGYDLYYTAYPNYQSLASQFGTEVGAPNPGSKVLDNFSHNLSWRGDFALPGGLSAWGLALGSVAEYPQQLVVNSTGAYDNSNREDLSFDLQAGASKRLPDLAWLGRIRPWVSLMVGGEWVGSNQNHFDPDPNRLKFVPGYYNYSQFTVGPGVTLQFLKLGLNLDASWQLQTRSYSGRLTQDVDGNYTGTLLHQTINTVAAGVSCPLPRGFEAQLRFTWADASSNNAYQQTYVYDYTTENYYGGVAWRF